MLTLNQIKQRLIAWFNSHAQINAVKYETDFEFNAQRDLLYPAVNIEWQDASIQENATNHNFRILIGDLFDANHPEQAHDVHSDVMQIAEDFFSFLQNEEGWIFSKSTRINQFVDDMGDRVAGVVFVVTLSTVRPQNTCQKPDRVL